MDWPQWRGPERLNLSRETGLLQAWPTNGPPLRWTVHGLGNGIAAAAVAEGNAYTLGYRDGGEYLFALDAASGEQRWITPTGSTRDQAAVGLHSVMRWLSPRVPTVDADRIYTISAGGVLTCLRTADGSVQWRKDYPAEFLSPSRVWGFCDYPLVDGENLVISPMGAGAAVVALNKRTGDVVWRCALPTPDIAGHGALVVSEATGVRQYVSLLGKSVVGISAGDGRLLWRHMRPALRVASSYTPLVLGDLVATANGYGGGLNLLRLSREATDLASVQEYQEKIDFNPFQDSTLLIGDRLHVIEGPGLLTCLDLRTGKRLYSADTLPSTRRTAITCADGRVYLRRSDGTMSLVEVQQDAYAHRGTFSLPNPEEVSGVTFPVVANGRLYLRDNDRLLCYDVRAEAPRDLGPVERPLALPSALSRSAETNALPTPPRTGVDRGPDAIFVPTPADIVERMLGMVPLASTNVVYDLGSGDGRIVIAAARAYGCRAVGIEIDPHLVAASREAVRAAGFEERVRIDHADMFTVDFSDADLVTAYLPSHLLERLLPQFEKLKPGARIVTHQFAIPAMRPLSSTNLVSTEDGDLHRLHIWAPPRPGTRP